jgi:hypothetical protein
MCSLSVARSWKPLRSSLEYVTYAPYPFVIDLFTNDASQFDEIRCDADLGLPAWLRT